MDVDLTIIIQLVLFVGMLTVLNRLVFRHFLRVMEQRHEKTQAAVDEAERLERVTAADQDAYQTRMREAQAAAQREREVLRGKGRDEQRRLVNEARATANETLAQARSELERAEEQAESALTKSAAELADLLVRKVIGPTVVLAIALVGAQALAASGGHGGHEAPHVNWWTWSMDAPPVGWFLLDFVLFVWIIVHYTRRPIAKAFAERHERIKRVIGQAQERFGRARAIFDEYRSKLAHVEDEMAALVDRGRQNGEAERQQIISAGTEFATRLQRDAETVATQEIERAQGRLRVQTAHRALVLAEAKLRSKLSPEEQQRLVEQAIVELEQGTAVSAGARP